MRKVFNEIASEIIKSNDKSALILGDIGVYGFREVLSNHPKQVYNIGILEQTMVSISAGLASEGIIPIIHTIAPFMVERALEQIKVDFGYQNLPGNFVSVGASFDYSKLGCTHHCPADINILSNIAGLDLFIPGHHNEFKSQFINYWDSGRINYFRLSENENEDSINLELGEIKRIKNGVKGIIIVMGPFLEQTLLGLEDLDIEIHYVNSISSIKQMQIESMFSSRKVVIIEPYYSGALLIKLINQLSMNGCEILQIGIPVVFLQSYGSYQEQLISLNLDPNSLKKRVETFISS
jgi:transketolase